MESKVKCPHSISRTCLAQEFGLVTRRNGPEEVDERYIFKGFENLILCISFHLFFVFHNLEASSVVNSKSVRKKILNYLLESLKGGDIILLWYLVHF